MRKIGMILVVVAVVMAGFFLHALYRIKVSLNASTIPYQQSVQFPVYPSTTMVGRTKLEQEKIKQGEYLVKVGDCISCHTNALENGPPFAGNLAITTPFGIIYSPNLTPDRTTGLGGWSDADFIKAMRKGISPDGHYYYPAFPFFYFNRIKTEDLLAIKAYLNALSPIYQKKKQNHMIWPFEHRLLQWGWRLLFFRNEGNPISEGNKSPEWSRGAYLVNGLGHCGMCHTPSYYLLDRNIILGAPIQNYYLSGASVEGYLAPNITQSALSGISNEDLMKTFTDSQMLGVGALHGPMLETVHNSLSYLSTQDLMAVVTYLKSVHSESSSLPIFKGSSLGETVYKQHCAICHNVGAGGSPIVGDVAHWKPLLMSGVENLYQLAFSGAGAMPPKGGCEFCSQEDIEAAVDYMILKSR